MFRSQLSASGWAVSIDLKDAYLHIPFHLLSRSFLGFQFLGRTFQFKVLPFGLKVFPWVFTRVVATLVGHLRQLGLRLFYYLDVWLLVAESRDLLESHLRATLLWTRDLGFLVNWVKSSLTPQRLPFYLGAHFDIPRLLARPSEHRVLALQGDSGSYQGSFGARPLLAEIFRPPCRLRGLCPQLQAADEASSASSSEVLHSLDRLSGLTCSLESRIQGIVRGVGLSFSPSRREAFCCSSPFVGHHHGRVRSGVGGSSSPSPCVRGLVEGGGL